MALLRCQSPEVTMWPRMTRAAVWLAVATVVCGLAWGSSECHNKAACSSCVQTPHCMWCGRPGGRSGNMTGGGGTSLSQCVQHTDNVREACSGTEEFYEQPSYSSERCHYHGTYQCGECHCDAGYIGHQCECDSRSLFGGMDDREICRETRSSAVCSARGTCFCGECECNKRRNPEQIISGRFCECTNYLCPRYNGLLCGGPDRGECVCNQCVCKPGCRGEDCLCEESNHNCINPETGVECSGQGVCEHGRCRCRASEHGRYSGKYCEDCPLCKGKCVEFKVCVECQVFGTGDYDEEECRKRCTLFKATTVTNLVETEGEKMCVFFNENDCRFRFVYGYDEHSEPVVRVCRTLDCPPPEWPWGPPPDSQTTASISVLRVIMFVVLLLYIV